MGIESTPATEIKATPVMGTKSATPPVGCPVSPASKAEGLFPAHIGVHVLADFHGLQASQACDAALLSSCLLDAAKQCRLTPLSAPVVHVFPNGGLTAFLPLSESHIALHTFPEYGYLALDVFSCGKGDPLLAIGVLRTALSPTHVEVQKIRRGGFQRDTTGEKVP